MITAQVQPGKSDDVIRLIQDSIIPVLQQQIERFAACLAEPAGPGEIFDLRLRA